MSDWLSYYPPSHPLTCKPLFLVTVFGMQQDFPPPSPSSLLSWPYPSVSNRPYKLQPWWMVPSLQSWRRRRTSRKTFGTRMSLNFNLPFRCWLLPRPSCHHPLLAKHLQLLFAATSLWKMEIKIQSTCVAGELMESELKPKIKRKIHLTFYHPTLPHHPSPTTHSHFLDKCQKKNGQKKIWKIDQKVGFFFGRKVTKFSQFLGGLEF